MLWPIWAFKIYYHHQYHAWPRLKVPHTTHIARLYYCFCCSMWKLSCSRGWLVVGFGNNATHTHTRLLSIDTSSTQALFCPNVWGDHFLCFVSSCWTSFFFFIFPLLLKYFDWNSPFYWPIQMNEWRWRVCCAFKIKLMFLVAGGGWERSSVNKDSPNTGHWVTDEWMRKTSTTWLGLIVEEHYKIVHELYLCTGYPVEPIGTQDDTLQEDHILHIRWSSHWSMCCS